MFSVFFYNWPVALDRLTRCGDTGAKQGQGKAGSNSLAGSVKKNQAVSKARTSFLSSANKTSRQSNRSSSRNQTKEKGKPK